MHSTGIKTTAPAGLHGRPTLLKKSGTSCHTAAKDAAICSSLQKIIANQDLSGEAGHTKFCQGHIPAICPAVCDESCLVSKPEIVIHHLAEIHPVLHPIESGSSSSFSSSFSSVSEAGGLHIVEESGSPSSAESSSSSSSSAE